MPEADIYIRENVDIPTVHKKKIRTVNHTNTVFIQLVAQLVLYPRITNFSRFDINNLPSGFH